MSKEIKLGIFGILVIVCTVYGYRFLAGENLFGSSKYYYIYVDNAKGLIRSSPVFVKGFQVGTVTDIAFVVDAKEESKVKIEMRIDEPVDVKTDAVAEILETGFVGGKAIRIKIDPRSSAAIAKSGVTLTGRTLNIIEAMVGGPEELGPYADVIKKGLVGAYDTIAVQANDPTAPGVGKIFHDMDIILADMKVTTRNLNRLIATSNQQVSLVMTDLAAITNNLKQSNTAITKIIDNTASLTAKIDSAGLDETIINTNEAIGTLKTTMASTQQSLAHFDKLLVKANSGDGSLAKLMNDPDLYINLSKSLNNMNYLLQDFRLNPKRYVNVSVFGKKQKKYNLPKDDPAKQK